MYWVLKKPSHRDGFIEYTMRRFFEHPQHMIWLRNKQVDFFRYELLTTGLLLSNDFLLLIRTMHNSKQTFAPSTSNLLDSTVIKLNLNAARINIMPILKPFGHAVPKISVCCSLN